MYVHTGDSRVPDGYWNDIPCNGAASMYVCKKASYKKWNDKNKLYSGCFW